MALTTPDPPIDLTQLFPELRAYARTAVRLHPRPGKPTMHDSHIGAPLIWPVAEPWPSCDQTLQMPAAPFGEPGWADWGDRVPETSTPMVGVAQFYARDIPEIPFPEGVDLLQVLWCPNEHELDDIRGPAPLLVWRSTADLTDVLTEPPMRHHATPDSLPGAPAADLSREDYLPRPCVLHPERVTEYPDNEELPEQVRTALNEWDDQAGDGSYQYLLSMAPGCKIGGWESWHLTDMYPLPCTVCGTETEPLLKLDSSEWDGGSEPRWRPWEERHLEWGTPECEETVEPTTLALGRSGALTIFLCPRSTEHGYRLTIQ
ncbi:hypothetical protein [Planomonospora parontospora]|uniref:hypothetical protein n=1 Tax=Planomonospora parontospora TaxID=58119 RepID=UPI0016704EDD|nr:hypothetical protein [Planomonospora parontospora]GGL22637.1 hypothetical protein GCM10014719_25780 [Planomonospora parontospora subsp. antibiotica]GII14942.1 hypothetical protein Ppa05_16680 [Planomonospora parontospora subsp. antibiotica]